MRLKARIDVNQNEIVTDLRKLGYSVAITSQLGKGFPDLVVGHKHKNYLFEIKDPKKKGELTKDEKKFKDNWNGQYNIIRYAYDAVEIIKGGKYDKYA